MASSALHTGIQRVAREVVTRWVRDHPGTLLAFFDDSHHVYRLLEREERDRLLGWREHLDTSGDRVSDRSLRLSERALVPWRCRLVCPEVPGTSRSHALRSLTAAGIQDSLTLIGYDLIPIIAADVVPKGVPESFSHYLSVVGRADRISAISRQSAEGFRAFATTLESVGVPGPEVEAQPLPSVVPTVTDDVIESARKALGVVPNEVVQPRGRHLFAEGAGWTSEVVALEEAREVAGALV